MQVGRREQRKPVAFVLLCVAQGDAGIDAGGAVGGDVAGNQGYDDREGGHAGIGDGIGGTDSDQEAGEQTGNAQGGEQANSNASADQDDGLAEDHYEDGPGIRAQGHAHTDFVGASPGGVGNDSVHADDSGSAAPRAVVQQEFQDDRYVAPIETSK
jgi:hypothetical protein